MKNRNNLNFLNDLSNLQLMVPHSETKMDYLGFISPEGLSQFPPQAFRNNLPIQEGLLMIHEDAPYPQNPTHAPFLHWIHLKKNPLEQSEVSYMGPQPPRDSNPSYL